MSKRIELIEGVTCSTDIKTTITAEEYDKCKELIPTDIEVKELSKVDGKRTVITYQLTQVFENVKELVLNGFEALTDEEKEVLALREYKTRDFQDSQRTELRNTLGITATIGKGLRELQKALKNDPEKLALLLKEYDIS